MTKSPKPSQGGPDILGRVEGDHVATALRQCPDPAGVGGPLYVDVEAGRLGRVRIRCERRRSRGRAIWYWQATRAVQVAGRRAARPA
jgi:hypothetical protein